MLAALIAFIAGVGTALAAQQTGKDSERAVQVKIKVIKLGVGEKARATVRMNDGTKIKGYISQAGENDFVIRDLKTDAPSNLFYKDVAKVESNRRSSLGKTFAIAGGITAGAVVAVLLIALATLD